MNKIKVYLIDDSIIIRAVLEALVARDAHLELCGMASDAEVALADINHCLPDVILLDLGLPGMDGLDFLAAIQNHWHAMNVIIVSGATKHGAKACEDAFERGAIACFDKSQLVSGGDELLRLIEEIMAHKNLRRLHHGDNVSLPPVPVKVARRG